MTVHGLGWEGSRTLERIPCIYPRMCRIGVYCTRSGHWLQQHGLSVIMDQAYNSDATFKANGKVFHESFCGLGLLFSTINGKPLPQKAFAEGTHSE
ncbi:hypothetical protein PO909_023690 [Leuciscus waleckii]